MIRPPTAFSSRKPGARTAKDGGRGFATFGARTDTSKARAVQTKRQKKLKVSLPIVKLP